MTVTKQALSVVRVVGEKLSMVRCDERNEQDICDVQVLVDMLQHTLEEACEAEESAAIGK